MEISSDDLESLRLDPTPALRGRIAGEIGREFAAGGLSAPARADAVAIFRALLDDVEIEVRRAMAEALARTPDLPGDIAIRLVRDVFEVAQPVLQYSRALTDDDLIAIVNNPVPADSRRRFGIGERSSLAVEIERRLISMARRAEISAPLSARLVDAGGARVVVTLVANPGAVIAEPVAQRAIDRFAGDAEVQSAFVGREGLPVAVVERLLFLVSEAMRKALCERNAVAPATLAGVARQVKERGTIALIVEQADDTASQQLVDSLARRGRLSATLILRALCERAFAFVERALAALAKQPLEAVRGCLRHGDAGDREALYRQARLPLPVQPALDRAISASYREGVPHDAGDAAAYRAHMVAVIAPFAAQGDEPPPPDIDTILARLSRGG